MRQEDVRTNSSSSNDGRAEREVIENIVAYRRQDIVGTRKDLYQQSSYLGALCSVGGRAWVRLAANRAPRLHIEKDDQLL